MLTSLAEFLKNKIHPAIKREQFFLDIITCITNTTKKTIDPNTLLFKNNVIFITAHPIVKSEIILKKKIIIETLKNTHPKITITDIR